MQCQIMYMDTDSSIIHIKIIEVYEHIDVEKSMKSMIWKLWNYETMKKTISNYAYTVKQKSDWINKRWIRRKNYDKICES